LYAVIDIETTGLSPVTEKITEIAVLIWDGEKIIDEFSSLINPERGVSPFITRLTGITNEMLSQAPKFYEIARTLVELTENCSFVAHNAQFDYAFIREEFRNLGYNFIRSRICTVKLSRKLMPGLKKYGLSNLCRELGIQNHDPHRARSDAHATLALFQHLIKLEGGHMGGILGLNRSIFSDLHPNMSPERIAAIPEICGVYYFFDQNDQVIYIGKSINIRQRIIQHLGTQKSKKASEMRLRIAAIDYEICGSELAALILESYEIKKHKPLYNRTQLRTFFRYGLFLRTNENGYSCLSLEKIRPGARVVSSFVTKKEGREFLARLCKDYALCQKLCGLYESTGPCFQYQVRQCLGACVNEEDVYSYNQRLEKALEKLKFPDSSFIIVDKGKDEDQRCVFRISKGQFMGYSFVDKDILNNVELIIDSISPKSDNRDIQYILKNWLSKNKAEKIIHLLDN
jgi:DNA polymerase III subunit epsilon